MTENTFNPLRTSFRKNGMGYQLKLRNQQVALFALSTDRHWEVDRIYLSPASERFGKHFPAQEIISNEEQFGKDGSRTFQDHDKALLYFTKLSKKLACDTLFDSSHSDSEPNNYTTKAEIVPPSENIPVRHANKTSVVRLKEVFKKNGLEYRQIERTESVGLYGQYVNKTLCGFEAARIKILPPFTPPTGKQLPEREGITSNDEFGISDGSKTFFALEPKRAKNYFESLVEELESIKNGWGHSFYTPHKGDINEDKSTYSNQ